MERLNEDGWFVCEKDFYDYMINLQQKTGLGYGRMIQIISQHWRLQDPIKALEEEDDMPKDNADIEGYDN